MLNELQSMWVHSCFAVERSGGTYEAKGSPPLSYSDHRVYGGTRNRICGEQSGS
jgi:hypothetical protein